MTSESNLNDRKKLWWIASYPKSGSTWVRMFLNSYITGFPPNINSAWQYATGDLQPHMYQLTSAQPIDKLNDTDILYFRPAVLSNYILTSYPNDKCLKTHHAKVSLDDIPLIPPRLSKGALYIIRDPRDIAVSFANHFGCSIDESISKMINNGTTISKDDSNLCHVLASWATHVDSWTIKNKDVRTTVVKYEDMLNDTENAFRTILSGLGFSDIDDLKLKIAIENTKFSKLQEQEKNNGFKENGKGGAFFRNGESGNWRDLLTQKQRNEIEKKFCQAMTRFGYLKKKNQKSNSLPKIKSNASGSII